jgi:cytochrome c oxidase cbb3-type subunit 2
MIGLRMSSYCAVALVAVSAFQWWFSAEPTDPPMPEDLVALGRRVYVSEGCIHCHSQYVRPVGRDTELWGARTTPGQALSQEPVLIGNRRQGPDLANVGLRRDAGWNRLHLTAPAAVVPGSRMPSYRHLVEGDGTRGEALLAYLDSLRPGALYTGNPAAHPQYPEDKL